MMSSLVQINKRVVYVSIVCMMIGSNTSFAQNGDTTFFFRSAVTVTQNGFSLIPSFSLGKPAVILEPAVGNKRLTFEPQFRFALEGKPWSFIFIYRYKVIATSKFQLQIGGHIPTINFVTESVTRNGTTSDAIVSRRLLAGELIPNYKLSENVSIGMYILRGHGFDKGGFRDSFFSGFRCILNSVKLTDGIFFKLTPQVYYLKVDDNDGTYVTNILTLAMRKFPISISNIVNKAIQSDVPGKDFDWNVSLIYTFDKTYIRK
jgi:hypothetical protein